MKPLPNKINVPLLILSMGSLIYWIIVALSLQSGTVIVTGQTYPIYISLFLSLAVMIGMLVSIRMRQKWEKNRQYQIRMNAEKEGRAQ
ncbi:MAG: hypothetical protein ACYCT2_04620 [Thermoplasmataceae archaeon]